MHHPSKINCKCINNSKLQLNYKAKIYQIAIINIPNFYQNTLFHQIIKDPKIYLKKSLTSF